MGRRCFNDTGQGNTSQKIVMFQCVRSECSYCSPRADKVKEHMKKQHQTAFPNQEDLKAAGKHLPWRQETNSKFINPGKFQAPIPVHFKTPAEPKDKSQHQHQQQQQHEETKKNHCKTSKPLHLYSRDDLIKKFKAAEYQKK